MEGERKLSRAVVLKLSNAITLLHSSSCQNPRHTECLVDEEEGG